ARGYVESLDLDESLLLRRDELMRISQRMIQVSREIADQKEDKVHYQDFLDRSFQVIGTRTATKLVGPSTYVFVAEPRTLTITNFLGVQNIININYRRDLPRGLTFLDPLFRGRPSLTKKRLNSPSFTMLLKQPASTTVALTEAVYDALPDFPLACEASIDDKDNGRRRILVEYGEGGFWRRGPLHLGLGSDMRNEASKTSVEERLILEAERKDLRAWFGLDSCGLRRAQHDIFKLNLGCPVASCCFAAASASPFSSLGIFQISIRIP
ncbi:hypothetical protein CEP51_016763, partial [Fusarium floridanum]